MKAKILRIAIMAGLALTAIAGADLAAATAQPVSIQKVRLLEEKIVQNSTKKGKSNNWERSERRERERGWWSTR